MKNRFVLVLCTGLVGATPALPSGMPVCTADAMTVRMSADQATARARMMGYKVKSVEPDQGCWRVEVSDDRGRRLVLRLHAGSGELMARIDPTAVDRHATASTD